jgi:hypothetical protein
MTPKLPLHVRLATLVLTGPFEPLDRPHERDRRMRNAIAAFRAGLRWVGRQLGRIVADSPPSTRPPGGNYIPNSNGEGGRVISSGDSGANS